MLKGTILHSILLIILLLGVVAYFYLTFPRKLNKKIKDKVNKHGLSHVTNLKNKDLIMDIHGYANFKSACNLKCYANFFRKSVFFFIGIPSYGQCKYNISSLNQDKIIVKILPENINSYTLESLRWRKLDKAVIHRGNLKIKAEVCEFKLSKKESV